MVDKEEIGRKICEYLVRKSRFGATAKQIVDGIGGPKVLGDEVSEKEAISKVSSICKEHPMIVSEKASRNCRHALRTPDELHAMADELKKIYNEAPE